MLWTAVCDPDPVVVFERGSLYNVEGELADDAGAVDIDRAAVRRPGDDLTLIPCGRTLHTVLDCRDHRPAPASPSASPTPLSG